MIFLWLTFGKDGGFWQTMVNIWLGLGNKNPLLGKAHGYSSLKQANVNCGSEKIKRASP